MNQDLKTGEWRDTLTAGTHAPRQEPAHIEASEHSGSNLPASQPCHTVERASRDNPDLPVSFVAASLTSLAEPREDSLPFVPRSGTQT